MTRHDPCGSDSDSGELSGALRWQLRALRQDALPERDLWVGVAPRLEARATPATPMRTPWLALAASVLLVVGVAGIWRGNVRDVDTGQLALVEARRMSTDYRHALDALPAGGDHAPALAPAMDELDRSAVDIRRALAQDPDSRLLLEQLRRTYARRLQLSQRAIVG